MSLIAIAHYSANTAVYKHLLSSPSLIVGWFNLAICVSWKPIYALRKHFYLELQRQEKTNSEERTENEQIWSSTRCVVALLRLSRFVAVHETEVCNQKSRSLTESPAPASHDAGVVGFGLLRSSIFLLRSSREETVMAFLQSLY